MIKTIQNGLIQIGGENVNNSMFWISFSYGCWKVCFKSRLARAPGRYESENESGRTRMRILGRVRMRIRRDVTPT